MQISSRFDGACWMAANYGSIVFLVVCISVTALLRLGPRNTKDMLAQAHSEGYLGCTDPRCPRLIIRAVFVVHLHDPTVSLRVRVAVDDGRSVRRFTTSLHTSRSGEPKTVIPEPPHTRPPPDTARWRTCAYGSPL